MTELEILKRAEAYTFERIDKEDRKNESFKEEYGYDDPISMELMNSYWDDIFDIWKKIKEVENTNKNR